MTRRALLSLAAAAALLAGPVAAARAAAPHPSPAPSVHAGPRFTTSGRWLRDGEGRTLVLRGLDVMGAEFTPTAQPLPYGPSDFAAIRALGATVVRIPIAWANVEPEPGRYDPAALGRIADIVQWAGRAGLLVVLDMHQWHWSPCFGGNGMPSWTVAVPCPAGVQAGWATVPLEAAAEGAFWSDPHMQQRLAAAWAAVVRAVQGPSGDAAPWVLGYDLLNEPPGGTIPPAVFDSVVLPAWYRTAAAAVRAADPGALVVVEPPWNADPARTTMTALGIPRAVYSPHLYGDSLNDAAGDAGDVAGPAQFGPDLTLGAAEADRVGAAFWPGEWGYLNPGTATGWREGAYADDMLAAQDADMVGSAYWTYSATPQWWWTADTVARLTRPSPFAVAGTPVSFATSEHGLRLTWTAAAGDTLVSVPAAMHPVVHAGPGVTWSPAGPGWLAFRAPAGTTATVTVTG